MTNWKVKLGAVLVALAFLALPAAAASATLNAHNHHTPWGIVLGLAFALGTGVAGTVTVTWASFVPLNPGATFTGGTTPPTAGQAASVYQQTVSVACTDADTNIAITHNMGIGAAQAAVFLPELLGPYLTALGTGTFMVPITWNFANPNVLVGTKLTTAGSGCTFNVILRNPAP